jgi:ABC transport system ATP-binding/permease protein
LVEIVPNFINLKYLAGLMAKTILLNTHKLEKSFSNRILFRDVSFGINDNERIGLVGPNGAGKTTLLKIIAKQIELDGGTITLKKGLRLGFMEQTPTFTKNSQLLDCILEKCADRDDSYGKAYELLAALELSQFGEDHLVEKLSGGWQKRVALARELILEPELLLLDEPTNHLDVTSILWLEEYLHNAPFSVLMITHDRLFLQRVVNRVLDLDPRNPNYLLSVNGDYAQYLEAKDHELAALQRHERVQKNTLRRELEWLSRGAIARLKKQTARIKSTEKLRDDVDELQRKNVKKTVALEFGEADRAPKRLIEAKGISKSFGEKTLFKNLDLLITPKTRLALLGENGCGKSTLVKVLLGIEKADSGEVKTADDIQISYFEQGRETLDFKKSVLKNICPEGDFVNFQGDHVHARSYLDKFLFSGTKPDMPVAKLSGGEQARLRLAQIMLKTCQVLILDEPTNDLDADTLDVLENALSNFKGAVILVTHDRYFLDAVSNQILAFEPNEFSGRNIGLQTFANYFQWESWFSEEKLRPLTAATASASSANLASPTKEKLSYKEKYELENMEASIHLLEAKVATLQEISTLPENLADHKKLSDIHTQLAAAQSELDTKFKRWAELEKKV